MRAGKILHVVQNEFLRDSRVLREVKSLSDVGYRVRVLALQDEENKLARHEKKDGFTVERVRLRSRKLPKRLPFQLIKYIEYLIQS